jgi:hypothetical protein
MEALLVLGVAAVGYELSKSKERETRARRRERVRDQESQQTSVHDMIKFSNDVEAKRYAQAAYPRRTGVFDPVSGPEMVDLPRGRAPMPATEAFSAPPDRVRERDGYSQTGTWNHKVEAGPRFDPGESAVRVSYNGSGGNPYSRPRDPTSSMRMNNVAPTAKLSVGSGLGYGPDVPAADGFHPYFRSLPNNVGVYKKNNLPGNFVPGKNPVDFRTSQYYQVEKYLPPKFYDMKRRPLGPNMARVTAPREREKEPREVCGGHDLSEAYFGNPALVNGVETVMASKDNAHATRDVNERNVAESDNGPIGPGTTVPAPMIGKDGTHMDEGRFEKLHNYETDGRNEGPAESLVKSGFVAMPEPQKTLREQTGARPYGHFLGIAAPTNGQLVQQGRMDRTANSQLDRHAKRGDQLVEGFVSIGKFNAADELTFGEVGQRDGEIGGRVMSHPMVTAANPLGVRPNQPGYDARAILNAALIGAVDEQRSKSSRVDPHNPWAQDLSLAADQLANNPANHTFSRPSAATMAPVREEQGFGNRVVSRNENREVF